MGDAAPPAASDELVKATAPLGAAAMDAAKGIPESTSFGDGSKAGVVSPTETSMSTRCQCKSGPILTQVPGADKPPASPRCLIAPGSYADGY
jgi:hypothetical protein